MTRRPPVASARAFRSTRARRAHLPGVLLLVALSALPSVTACAKSSPRLAAEEASAVARQGPAPAGGPSGGDGAGTRAAAAGRAMRITVDTTLVVTHRDAAVSALRAAVSAFGGYVSQGSLAGADVGGSANFTVKVPAASVSDFRASLTRLGEVRSDSETAEDVTEARADIKARLHNARAQEARLLDLLSNHAGNLADVVLLEKELSGVRETVERMEAEERGIDGQVAFATVKVALVTVYLPEKRRPGLELSRAARDGLETAQSFLFGTITLALSVGPTLAIVLVMLYLAYRGAKGWTRRRRRSASVG